MFGRVLNTFKRHYRLWKRPSTCRDSLLTTIFAYSLFQIFAAWEKPITKRWFCSHLFLFISRRLSSRDIQSIHCFNCQSLSIYFKLWGFVLKYIPKIFFNLVCLENTSAIIFYSYSYLHLHAIFISNFYKQRQFEISKIMK